MSRLKPLTHEEHLILADKFKNMMLEMDQIEKQVWQSYGVSCRAAKILGSVKKKLAYSFRSEMDIYYHKATDHEQYAERGHAYYSDEFYGGGNG
jgi:hypothetical protein